MYKGVFFTDLQQFRPNQRLINKHRLRVLAIMILLLILSVLTIAALVELFRVYFDH